MTSDAADGADAFWLLGAALLIAPPALLVCLRLRPWIALAFVALLVLFSSSTWGQLQEENTLYARGTGLFYFSLLNLLLWLATAATVLRMLSHQPPGPLGPLGPLASPPLPASPFPVFIASYGFLLAGHLAVGLLAGQTLQSVLSYTGLLNVLNMALFSLVLLAALADAQGRRRLLLTLLGLCALRAAFGLARYVWFGGDSANPYRNFERLDIRLVYFDIGDNYFAALAAFCIAWLLLMPGTRMSLWRRSWLLSWLAMEIATVVLSFRRSSLIGLALMSGVLFWRLPWQRKLVMGVVSMVAATGAAGTLLRERLQAHATEGSGFLASLLYDIGPQRATGVSRFYELEAAAHSLGSDWLNWLFGLGSWGVFHGNEDALDYHFGKFDFVHSGFGHLILKSGTVGLLLFIALLMAVMLHYRRTRAALLGNSALLADAGMAGLLFWMPTLLIGTPVIEFRTMLLIGLTLALPYLAALPATRSASASAGRHAGLPPTPDNLPARSGASAAAGSHAAA